MAKSTESPPMWKKLLNICSILAIIVLYSSFIAFVCIANSQPSRAHGMLNLTLGVFVGTAILQFALTKDIFDVHVQFSFYATYHHDPWNQFIHFLCIWPIYFSSLVFMTYTVQIFTIPVNLSAMGLPDGLPVAWCSFLWMLVYAIYYACVEQPAGFLGALMAVLCFFLASWWQAVDAVNAFWQAGVIHIAAWVLQFVGHGVFEGRAPALLENLAQAFLMAPMFVLLETLFMFGYRPVMKAQINEAVAKNLEALTSDKSHKLLEDEKA